MADRFVQHARTVSGLTFLSRITGLVRDAAFSRMLGAGGVMDAFFFAFMIPNLFRRLFGEGALAAAFLPVYARLHDEDPDVARALATRVSGLLVTGLGIIVLVGELVLLGLTSTGHGDTLALRLTMIMLPYMPMVCLVAVLGAMLQVQGRFGPTAAAPVVLNACLVAATVGGSLLWADAAEHRVAHVSIVSAALLVAGILQVAWSLWALRGEAWWHSDRTAAREPLRAVARQALPMIVGLGVLQLNTLFDGLIASYPKVVGPTIFGHAYPLSEGAMSAVSYAQRLYQFPLGVFGIAVATAIFPALSRAAGRNEEFLDTLRRGLRLVIFIGLPASVGLMLVRDTLTAVIFEGGDFTADNTARVARVLLGYAPAIWAYSMTHTLTRAFYAQRDSITPVKIAVGVVALNLALNCTLIWTPLRESGLAWSTAVCAVVQVLLLAVTVRRRHGALLDKDTLGSWGRSLAASAIMGACVFGARLLIGPPTAWAGSAVALAIMVGVGIAAFAVSARVMRMAEMRWLLKLSN